jgi:hypothetical protein
VAAGELVSDSPVHASPAPSKASDDLPGPIHFPRLALTGKVKRPWGPERPPRTSPCASGRAHSFGLPDAARAQPDDRETELRRRRTWGAPHLTSAGCLGRSRDARRLRRSDRSGIVLGPALPSLSGVAQDEVVEAILPVSWDFTGRGEETQEQLSEMIGSDAVEVVLSFAARLDEP